ncbi:ImmA/IrrE family metallo-endopeptidase [Clostridium ljungdahlii]|uniref:IrrE N-terminal-like domain-containing protein n=1 Tax=Clostridium ljungdahlii TaxID=1538 RepID=A0A170NC76_9CLOT|nr:ImmA/IrrE family metallo-endopeptidase [Clostridium ljungdahlii]OAA83287.1 hypothetical protein WY13_03615 [Clostridium ljungdahlii]
MKQFSWHWQEKEKRYEDIGENTKGFYISLITNNYIVINSKLNEIENEANKFAAELLIDEKDIKYSLENMCKGQIASYFGVNEKLVEYKFNK